MKRIKYIAYYDTQESKIKRNYVLSACNKMDYIISSINRAGIGVDIISFSGCITNHWTIDFGGVQNKTLNTLRHFTSFGPSNKPIVRVLSRYFQIIQLVIWFLLNVQRNEKIIVYHSLGYCKILTFLKRLKKCYYIGEIEEIYQDVSPQKASICIEEYKFIQSCDSYIFPTLLLNEKLNQFNKPYIIIHGIYSVETSRNVSWGDSDIHVVYAGTFDTNKGGANAAVDATQFLPEGYHMHICGFGTESDTQYILNNIERISSSAKAKISYEGLLRGEDFIRCLQKCHIGVSTQNPDSAFNNTSFPSKILTYLSNGLNVVSIRIPVVEMSDVSDCISYYNKQTPEEIAKAILSISKISNSKIIEIFNDLDQNFNNNIKYLLLS